MPYLSQIGALDRARQERDASLSPGLMRTLASLADAVRTGTKNDLSGDMAGLRYMPTLDEAMYRLEQYRKGTPVSQDIAARRAHLYGSQGF